MFVFNVCAKVGLIFEVQKQFVIYFHHWYIVVFLLTVNRAYLKKEYLRLRVKRKLSFIKQLFNPRD